jgi:hypothetical protein
MALRFTNQLITLLLLFSFNLTAQNVERPSTQATAITEKPVIDGEVIGDPIWQKINTIGALTQNQPNWGLAPSEKTDIRIAYTSTTFYLSVVCYDATPEKLVVSDARRDADLEGTDAFLFILDTYKDSQNGFVFGTNSVGIEYDAQVDNEGQGNFSNNRQQAGVIGGFNLNWDASWEVKAKVGDFGWSAEFAIPFRTLRFKSGDNQSWGVNFQRNIRKNNEIDFWAQIPLTLDIKRLSLAGTLTGLNIKNPGNLKVIPYALGRLDRDFETVGSETELDGEVGVDVKYSITPSMTLDLTYNTDFAQVEVDDQQVNLDRFNLFFPEKRPFFLENAGLFTVGSPGEVDLFFSRRIGISDNGQQVPIIGGARLSGKINKTSIGFLNMITDDIPDLDINKNNFTVARINHQEGRSAIGGLFVNRQGIGDDLSDDYNRTAAIDGRLGLGKKAQLSGFYAKTSTPGISEKDHSFKFQSNYNWNGWILNLAYTEVGEGFNPEVGFLGRDAFRKAEGLIFYNMRAKESSKFLENRPHISYRSYWDFEGRQQTGFLHIDNHWVWKNAFEIHTGINFTTEGVFAPFEISDGITVPANSYHHAEAQIVLITNPSKPVSISGRSISGGFFGGTRFSNSVSLNLRLGDKFNSQFGISHNDINLPNGDFTTDVFRTRLSYSFTPSIFTQSLIQYNSVADIWSANIRFGWLQQANTGLFLVYNESRGKGEGILNRSFILKYSRVFDVLK